METEDFANSKLRVPSQMNIATIENINKFINIIHDLPDPFENSDVVNHKGYPLNNDDNVSRVLSYFKYLDILTEERDKVEKDSIVLNKQYFHLTDKGIELKETALYHPNKIEEKFKEILLESELYKSLVENQEFEKWGYITKGTLRKMLGESFSAKVKNLRDRVDIAEDYIVEFLRYYNLFTLEGNNLKPISKVKKTLQKDEDVNIEGETHEDDLNHSNKNEREIKPKQGHTYIKDDDFELNIRVNDLSLALLKSHLTTLELKLKSMKKENNQNGE